MGSKLLMGYLYFIRWLFVLNKIKFLQLASKYKNVFY